MRDLTKKAITIGIIAGLLVFTDGIITSVFKMQGSFTWVSFISWTVFFGVDIKERIKAIPGYIIGFLAACAIMGLGAIFQLNLFGIALGAILSTVIVNFLVIYFEKFKKICLDSISGIFVGIALTFSGLGLGTSPSFQMLLIIVVYGILGLLAGWATIKFGTNKKN